MGYLPNRLSRYSARSRSYCDGLCPMSQVVNQTLTVRHVFSHLGWCCTTEICFVASAIKSIASSKRANSYVLISSVRLFGSFPGMNVEVSCHMGNRFRAFSISDSVSDFGLTLGGLGSRTGAADPVRWKPISSSTLMSRLKSSSQDS